MIVYSRAIIKYGCHSSPFLRPATVFRSQTNVPCDIPAGAKKATLLLQFFFLLIYKKIFIKTLPTTDSRTLHYIPLIAKFCITVLPAPWKSLISSTWFMSMPTSPSLPTPEGTLMQPPVIRRGAVVSWVLDCWVPAPGTKKSWNCGIIYAWCLVNTCRTLTYSDRLLMPKKQTIIRFSLKTSICTKIQELNYKILNRWYHTPQLLHRYIPSSTDRCWRCQQDEGTLLHIFWSCPRLPKNVKTMWFQVIQLSSCFMPPRFRHRATKNR